MGELKQPLSNVQLELLKLFTFNVPDQDLKVIKQILLRYKAERLMDMADQIWEEKKWTKEDIQKMLHTHLRTPYRFATNTP